MPSKRMKPLALAISFRSVSRKGANLGREKCVCLMSVTVEASSFTTLYGRQEDIEGFHVYTP